MSDYDYGYGEDKIYCYSGTSVLINKLDLRDPDALSVAERALLSPHLLDAGGIISLGLKVKNRGSTEPLLPL